jgi:hypothetical protein
LWEKVFILARWRQGEFSQGYVRGVLAVMSMAECPRQNRDAYETELTKTELFGSLA